MRSQLMIIDMSHFIFRAFYAIRPLTSPDGLPVNAVYGVLSMMMKMFEELKPSHILIARDSREHSVRKTIYPDYKANRSAPPDTLIPQFALIEELITLMNLPHVTVGGYEADDVIGSAVRQWKDHFDTIWIVSSDKDLMQFVDEKVLMVDSKEMRITGPLEVMEKMGVRPDQIVDFLSLVGDSSDNVPGVAGIGDKGAKTLLAEYQTLQGCIDNQAKIANKRLQKAIAGGTESAFLSKRLVEIVTDLNLERSFEECLYSFSPKAPLLDFLKKLGFKSFVAKLSSQTKTQKEESSLTEAFEILVLTLEQLEQWEGEKGPFYFASTLNEEGERLFTLKPVEDEDSSTSLWQAKESGELLSFLSKADIIGTHLQDDLFLLLERGYQVRGVWRDLSLASHLLDMEKKPYLPLALFERFHFIRENYPRRCEELKKVNLFSLWEEQDNPLLLVVAKMRHKGLLINADYFRQLTQEFKKELSSIEKEITDLTGESVNLRSPKQVGGLLFEKLALPVIQKGKTGPSTNQEVLEELALLGTSPVPDHILRFREIDKLVSTYTEVLPTLTHSDGRIRGHFDIAGTATGRFSSDRPNLQNIPIRTEEGRRLRKGFVAAQGYTLLSADYSQIELRLLAHFSKDPFLVKAFREGGDIHLQTAAEVFEKDISEVTPQERSWAKTVNFGLMYGQSSFGLSRTLKISRQEAKEYMERYFHKFSAVKAYFDELKELAHQRGYCETLLGRRRFLSEINSKNHMMRANAERLAVNTPIQGTNADLIRKAMVLIDQKIEENKFSSRLILQVHDELIYEVHLSEVEAMRKLVKKEMEGVIELCVPLKVDIGLGESWFDLK